MDVKRERETKSYAKIFFDVIVHVQVIIIDPSKVASTRVSDGPEHFFEVLGDSFQRVLKRVVSLRIHSDHKVLASVMVVRKLLQIFVDELQDFFEIRSLHGCLLVHLFESFQLVVHLKCRFD